MREAAEIAVGTVLGEVEDRGLELVRIVLYGDEAWSVHREVLEEESDGR
jgi:hypothetical protein